MDLWATLVSKALSQATWWWATLYSCALAVDREQVMEQSAPSSTRAVVARRRTH
jgi:hypothetical protein